MFNVDEEKAMKIFEIEMSFSLDRSFEEIFFFLCSFFLIKSTGTEIIGDDDIGHSITKKQKQRSNFLFFTFHFQLTRRIERSEYL